MREEVVSLLRSVTDLSTSSLPPSATPYPPPPVFADYRPELRTQEEIQRDAQRARRAQEPASQRSEARDTFVVNEEERRGLSEERDERGEQAGQLQSQQRNETAREGSREDFGSATTTHNAFESGLFSPHGGANMVVLNNPSDTLHLFVEGSSMHFQHLLQTTCTSALPQLALVIKPFMQPCKGFLYRDWPMPFIENFPFSLVQDFKGFTVGATGFHSNQCLGSTIVPNIIGSSGSICTRCINLRDAPPPEVEQQLNQLLLRVKSPRNVFSPLKYYTFSQLGDRVRQLNVQTKSDKLEVFNSLRSNSRRLIALNDYELLLRFIAENNVPGIRRVLASAFKRGCGTLGALNLVQRASAGIYHVKGYASDEALAEKALLALSIGGPRLLYAMQRLEAWPSRSWLLQHGKVIKLLPTVGWDAVHSSLEWNLMQIFGDPSKPEGFLAERVAHSIHLDEISVEERIRLLLSRDTHTRMLFIGFRIEGTHGSGSYLEFSVENVRTLQQLLDDSVISLAKEALVVGVAPLRKRDYATRPILIIGTAKKYTASDQLEIFRVLGSVWVNKGYDKVLGPLVEFSSDGDGKRRQGFRCFIERGPWEHTDVFGKGLKAQFNQFFLECPLLNVQARG